MVVSGNLYAAFGQRGGPRQVQASPVWNCGGCLFLPGIRDLFAIRAIMRPTNSSPIRPNRGVLSEFTAAFDRGNKFAAYRTLPSLWNTCWWDIEARRVETFRCAPEKRLVVSTSRLPVAGNAFSRC